MGAQLRVYKRRIRSVTATKKITKAMEMIAASRVVKAQRKVAASTPYATELTRAVTAVGHRLEHQAPADHGGGDARPVPRCCSSRATAVWPAATQLQRHQGRGAAHRAARGEGKEVDTYIVGRKGVAYYNFRERKVAESWTGLHRRARRTRTPRRSRHR